MSDRPRGITVVAILTLLGAAGLFLSFTLLVALGGMGHAGVSLDSAAMVRYQTLVYPPLILSFLFVFAVVGVLMGSKFGWYLSVLLWTLSIPYLVYAGFNIFPISVSGGGIFVAAVVLVDIIFVVYFQSEEVRSYFKMKRGRT